MSNNQNAKFPDGNQKKRKMGRNPSPRTLSPETAARFIQQAKGRKDVKITFGPSRPPATGNNSGDNNNLNRAVNYGSFDLQTLKETAAAAAATKPASSTNGGNGNNKDGLPCSEGEMKALMNMFLEIMGMAADSENNAEACNSSDNNYRGDDKTGQLFMFGNSSAGVPSPPGGWTGEAAEKMAAATARFFADGGSWDTIRRTYGAVDGVYDDYDEDDDSIPDLDEMRELFKSQQKAHLASMKQTNEMSSDWGSIEQAAMEGVMEAEHQAQKAAKKREKKQRKKDRQKEEAAQKAAQAAAKKREKAILSWRSRVVSACQSNEISKLEALLLESPLHKTPDEEEAARSVILPHLEFLLPNCVAKNVSQLERGKEARKRLAEYVLSSDVPVVFKPLRSGRAALHTACFHGDVQFLRLVLDSVTTLEDTEALAPKSCLNLRCCESGWTPLHYAAVSGSKEVLETLLAAGCDTAAVTDDTHTWRKRDGKGVNARELVQYITKEEHEKAIETHGIALQEMTSTFYSQHSERKSFLKNLEHVFKRLIDVENNGYSSPKDLNITMAEAESNGAKESQTESASTRKRKKKKKKKQAQKAANSGSNPTDKKKAAPSQSPAQEKQEEIDPLVAALFGMGFSEEQVNAAVKACGGTSRATADDLVTWILGQDADGNVRDNANEESGSTSEHRRQAVVKETLEAPATSPIAIEEVKKAEAAAREEAAVARRLAAKREEQRRRNRAWNDREQIRQKEAAKARLKKASAVPTLTPPPQLDLSTSAYPSLQSSISNEPSTGLQPRIQAGAKNGQFASKVMPPPKSKAVLSTESAGSFSRSANAANKSNPSTLAQRLPLPQEPVSGSRASTGLQPGIHTGANEGQHTSKVMPPMKAVLPMQGTGAFDNPAKPANRTNPSTSAPESDSSVHRSLVPLPTDQTTTDTAKSPLETRRPSSTNGIYGLSSIGDDERTVSSLGSNRGLSVSSHSVVPSSTPSQPSTVPVPPPGFMPTTVTASSHVQSLYSFDKVDPSKASASDPAGFSPGHLQVGGIRATAKAFVPTSFNQPIADSGSIPPLSGPFASSEPSIHAPPGPTGLEPYPTMGSFDMSQSLPPSLLATRIGGQTTMASGHLESNSPDSSSFVTSTTAAPGNGESSLAGIPLGFGTRTPVSSLLSSISSDPPVGASSIWGSTQGASSFGGLTSLPSEDSDSRNGESRSGGFSGWGAGIQTNLHTGEHRSIW
eukprot:scaffold1525_cov142-Cylindrotheca_fusiformis.AAC.51